MANLTPDDRDDNRKTTSAPVFETLLARELVRKYVFSTVVGESIIMEIPLTLRIMFCPSVEKERLASRSSHTVSFSLITEVFFVFFGMSEENSLRKLH